MINIRDTLKRLAVLVHWRSWQGRLVVWAAAAIAALTAVFFAGMVEYAIESFRNLQSMYAWLPFVITPLGGIVIVFISKRFFPGTEGSGIPQVVAALREPDESIYFKRLVSLRIAAGKILLTTAGLGCGFSTGREGPSVQIAASVMHTFRHLLPQRFAVHAHQLILAGGAAGLAAAFNTPLAGIVFAIEELGRKFEEKTNGILLTAIILAGVISISLQGNYTYFGHLVIMDSNRELLLPILIASAVGGVSGGIFSHLLLWSAMPESWLGRWRGKKSFHPLVLAGICGLLIALIGWFTNGDTHGSGYRVTREALEGQGHLSFLFAIGKFSATVLSYFSGIPGGIFAPSLSIGAGLGEALAALHLTNIENVAWMALCMTAFLAAATQAPITSFVIVMEMIDGHTLVVSLIATAFLSSMISRLFSKPLYQTLSYQMARNARAALAPPKVDAMIPTPPQSNS